MRRLPPAVLCMLLLCGGMAVAREKASIVLGLHADMSSGSALGGEAIRRGALIAISEINAQGGLLDGRELELVVKDHHGVPGRATEQLPELASTPNLVALLSGPHSPPVLRNLPFIHDHQLIVLSPWAAATDLVHHGRTPNYVFRVSANDARVGEFLVAQALARGHRKLGLILERTGWGRSSEKAIGEALARRQLAPASVQWVNWAEEDVEEQVAALERAGADTLLMVAHAPEGVGIVKAVARRPPGKRLPIYAHWGICGGDFVRQVGESLSQVELHVFQTYSFLGARSARARAVIAKYHELFGTTSEEQIFGAVGTAQAYDAVWLLARAIQKARSIERPRVRDALERLGPYAGLVRTYQPAFTPSRHEALEPSDYTLAAFDARGVLVPSHPRTSP